MQREPWPCSNGGTQIFQSPTFTQLVMHTKNYLWWSMKYKWKRLINTKGHEEYFPFCSMYNLGISNYYVKILSRERRLLSRQTKLILLVSFLHEVCISGHYLQQLDAQEETSMSRKCSLTSFFCTVERLCSTKSCG